MDAAATAVAVASSSSLFSPATQEKHDVFLSFRGVDTRDNFTSHLYAALCQKKIETYIDDRLERGDEISPSLMKAIEESKLSVIIFSKNYAFSPWCLDELLHILQCKEKNGQLVIPVFYHVEPQHVRRQKESYASAFSKLNKRFKDNIGRVQAWKVALTKAANISGWDSSVIRPECKLIETVVEDILKKLNRVSSNHNDLKGLVGIGRRIEQIEFLLNPGSIDVRIVGLWGMGGVGKTTLANVLYNRLSSQFEGCCFLANVREEASRQGLVNLRNKLIEELLQERILDMGAPSLGSPFVKERLRRKKVLIVLDDVNDLEQFECLAGDREWFGLGSRIIVTTRDVQVLKNIADGIYNVEELNDDEALQLFCLRAFKSNSPVEDYTELSEKVVAHAKGVALAVVVLGSYLHCRNKEAWESALTKLNKGPPDKVQKVLRISYDGLDPDQKDVFLDIACFFKGEHLNFVQRILDGCGFSAKIELETLIDNALISIVYNKIQMHDLVQKMGQEIVYQESMKEPGNRSRLWTAEDVCHVFRTNTGSAATEGMFLDMSKITMVHLSSTAFLKMPKLRLLKFYNSTPVKKSEIYLPQGLEYLPDALKYLHWDGFPLQSMPSKFTPQNLVELNMSYSPVERLWYGVQDLMSLKKINLSCCEHLIELPDLSKAQNVETLDLKGCLSIDKLPELPRNIKELHLNETAIEQVPSSIECLFNLRALDLIDCKRLECLPNSIFRLKSLEFLDLSGCSKLENFPEILEPMENLILLYLRETAIKEIPSSFENLIGLEVLNLDMCETLEFLPHNIFKLTRLEHLIISGCPNLKKLPSLMVSFHHLTYLELGDSNIRVVPEWLNLLTSLERLNLVGNIIEEIPPSIKQMSSLRFLDVSNCKNLHSLPELPLSLNFFSAQGCTSLETMPSSRTALTHGWDQLPDFGDFVFFNCLKLDQNSRNNIMDDAQLRILHVATQCWSKQEFHYTFRMTCFGNEIPTWFNYKSEGSSIHIKLPPNWGNTNFMGFVICAVASFEDYDFDQYFLGVQCESDFKTGSDEICKFDIHWGWLGGREDKDKIINSDHVFLSYWYGLNDVEKQRIFTEASFGFYPVDHSNDGPINSCKVTKCGIHLLYVEDAEEFGFTNNGHAHGNSYVVTDQAQPSGNGIDSADEMQEEIGEEPYPNDIYERKSTLCDCFSFLSRFQ